MVHEEEAGSGRRVRRWRSVAEKRRIAELTFEPGASVALVARAHGVNESFESLLMHAVIKPPLTERTVH